jgi:hypothetical protein
MTAADWQVVVFTLRMAGLATLLILPRACWWPGLSPASNGRESRWSKPWSLCRWSCRRWPRVCQEALILERGRIIARGEPRALFAARAGLCLG